METSQLLAFAEIANITYDDAKPAKPKFKELGYTIVEFFDIENAQAYLLKGSDGLGRIDGHFRMFNFGPIQRRSRLGCSQIFFPQMARSGFKRRYRCQCQQRRCC